MGCGASASGDNAGIVITKMSTGVLSENAFNLSVCGAAMSFDEGSKTIYLASNQGMTLLDISNPTDPQNGKVFSTGAIADDGGCAYARVHNTLFVAGGKGLKPIDLTDPKNPALGELIDTGVLSTFGGGADLAFDGSTTLYVAGAKGLATFDVSDPKAPKQVGNVIDTEVLLRNGHAGACVHGSNLYVVGGNGLRVLDITHPHKPQKIGGTINTGAIYKNIPSKLTDPPWSSGVGLALNGTLLYVLGGQGLSVFDISRPTAPAKVGTTIDTGATTYASGAALAVLGSKLLAACGKGLTVLDISDARAPKKLQSINTGVLSTEGPAHFMVAGPYTYLAGGHGLCVLDNSKISAITSA